MALPSCGDIDVDCSGNESSDSQTRTCKICYGTDDEFKDAWASPCKCNGSIKWIHKECLEEWIRNAPVLQKSKCNTCKFNYRRSWSVKPMEKWSLPLLRLSTWEVIEISLDVYSSIKLCRGFVAVSEGRKSMIGQLCYFVFWKLFIFNTRRIEYYKSMFRTIMASFFDTTIIDAES